MADDETAAAVLGEKLLFDAVMEKRRKIDQRIMELHQEEGELKTALRVLERLAAPRGDVDG